MIFQYKLMSLPFISQKKPTRSSDLRVGSNYFWLIWKSLCTLLIWPFGEKKFFSSPPEGRTKDLGWPAFNQALSWARWTRTFSFSASPPTPILSVLMKGDGWQTFPEFLFGEEGRQQERSDVLPWQGLTVPVPMEGLASRLGEHPGISQRVAAEKGASGH